MNAVVPESSAKTGILSTKQERAAWLIAEDEINDEAIAQQCGVTDRALRKWKQVPAFADRVCEIRAELAVNLSRYHIARKDKRVAALQDRWERQHQLIAERAEDPDMQHIPGASTGMVIRTFKLLGSGENARLVEEYAYDTGLDGSMRATEIQAAKETGQWAEKSEITGEMIVRRYIGIDIDVVFRES